jgi:hypothetical protein
MRRAAVVLAVGAAPGPVLVPRRRAAAGAALGPEARARRRRPRGRAWGRRRRRGGGACWDLRPFVWAASTSLYGFGPVLMEGQPGRLAAEPVTHGNVRCGVCRGRLSTSERRPLSFGPPSRWLLLAKCRVPRTMHATNVPDSLGLVEGIGCLRRRIKKFRPLCSRWCEAQRPLAKRWWLTADKIKRDRPTGIKILFVASA